MTCLGQVGGVKVGYQDTGYPRAQQQVGTRLHFEAKPCGAFTTGQTFGATRTPALKRAFRRAVNRAAKHGGTMYRGKWMTARMLGVTEGVPAHVKSRLPIAPPQQRRFTCISWNAGGLHDTKYLELLQWLQQQHDTGQAPDLVLIQETAWHESFEYVTLETRTGGCRWRAVHSGSGSKLGGLLCLISMDWVDAGSIRFTCLEPGRLQHVRILHDPPLDILHVYQHSWNPPSGMPSSNAKNKSLQHLLSQRKHIWDLISKWLGQMPLRNGVFLAGDYNTPLFTSGNLIGRGICRPDTAARQQDQSIFQSILLQRQLCALNTWSMDGNAAKTFIPITGGGTQIDFVMTRLRMADGLARQARGKLLPFVPATGGRHLPIHVSVASPTVPRAPPRRAGVKVQSVCDLFLKGYDAPFRQALHDQIHGRQLQHPQVDEVLLAAWQTCSPMRRRESQQTAVADNSSSVRQLWALRHVLRQHTAGSCMSSVLSRWRVVAQMQRLSRQLHKQQRDKRRQKVDQVLNADSVYRAARILTPKQPRKRLQLRTKEGSLQDPAREFQCLVDYFSELYAGVPQTPVPLPFDVRFSLEEVETALHKLAPRKVLPAGHAPAVLWRGAAKDIAPCLRQGFEDACKQGSTALPDAWNISDLVLLPKPGKCMKSPADVRPISLLHPCSKLLATILADRIKDDAQRYLARIPQFAYLGGRHLFHALDRVLGHCAEIRAQTAGQRRNIHHKKAGHHFLPIVGGMQISLDVSKAFDRLPRDFLLLAMQEARIDPSITSLIMSLHVSSRLRICHGQCTSEIPTHTGVRQGCSLAPLLWALYTGYVLRRLEDLSPPEWVLRQATVYADDHHFSWVVHSARDLDNALQHMSRVFTMMHKLGLLINSTKTAVLIDLKGNRASKLLSKSVIHKQGKAFLRVPLKDGVAPEVLDLPIVKKHTYLGISIGYGQFEKDTLTHRCSLAWGAFRRLKPILCNRSISRKQRLQLWQACVFSTLQHGLTCTGLTSSGAKRIRSLVAQQVRCIAGSFSMFTHERNADLLCRLGLSDPVEALAQAFSKRISSSGHELEVLRQANVDQWLSIVRARLDGERGAMGVRAGPDLQHCSLSQIDLVCHESFTCDICGLCFSTQAGLRSHTYKSHYDLEQKERRDAEVSRHKVSSVWEHGLHGMPTCKYCKHQFDGWPAFQYHINSRSCAEYRDFLAHATTDDVAALSCSLIDMPEMFELACAREWKKVAGSELLRNSLHHCVECNLWCTSMQYVRRHMLAKHKELVPLIRAVEAQITSAAFALQSPCPFCGQVFRNRRQHLNSCAAIFNAHYLIRRLAITQVRAPADHARPQGSHSGAGHAHLHHVGAVNPGARNGKHALWHHFRRHASGQARRGNCIDAGREQGTPGSTPSEVAERGRQGPEQSRPRQGSEAGLRTLRQSQLEQFFVEEMGRQVRQGAQGAQVLVMMGNLLLRHEDQQNITRLDGGFVLFLRTDVDNNLAKGLYRTAQQWKTTKQQYPEKLELPMRVVLFQSVVMSTAARWEKVISDPELLKKAIEAKWISPDGQTTLCLQWDNTKPHMPAHGGNHVPIKEVSTLLMELVTLAKLPLVVNRFHATRPLSEEYSSPVLPMLIEVGGRADAANKAWQILDRLAYTSVWISSTTYLRHERLQRSQLANRVSDYLRQMSWPYDWGIPTTSAT